ncbi:MAG TPA: GIY-YIG nuclease family protein, partial [Bacteroidia bacterium]|nr:GIY-YIG nuclease family protein [Bacteroidia bacterium]
MNKEYFVYILKCADDSYYVGVTNDLQRRLEEHNNSEIEISYTFSRRPVTLVWHET